MGPLLAMVGKDLRLLARDRMGFFFTFIFPLMIAIFFGTMFSGSGREPRGLSIALVDEDQSPESRTWCCRPASASRRGTPSTVPDRRWSWDSIPRGEPKAA